MLPGEAMQGVVRFGSCRAGSVFVSSKALDMG